MVGWEGLRGTALDRFAFCLLRRGWWLRALFCALACSLPAGHVAWGQSFDATRLKEPVDLSSPWLVHGGDDPAFAKPDLDDSQWLKFDPRNSIKPMFTAPRPEVVWYRLHVKVDPSQIGLALLPGSRPNFYSDGVVEAQNATGELFGFARGQEMSREPAAVIVAAAERFGQSDDITVVTVTRVFEVVSDPVPAIPAAVPA